MTPLTLETLLQHRLDQLNGAYAAVLDEQRYDEWPLFFQIDGRYKVQSRENHARGFPLGLMDLESRPDHLPRAVLHTPCAEPGAHRGQHR